ncbi:MAG: isoprenylcysteine carboxylmethyltransferase family protein [Bryobacteraceae bacterium]|jgi:protein-S-isoprenylcysteine O-methyltransferase Ste14
MVAKIWLALAATSVVLAALLFGSAGTMRWYAGWAFLVIFSEETLRTTRMLARDDPALLAERMKFRAQKGQPLWDKIFLAAMQVVWCGWLVLMGLDSVRFAWSSMPAWLQWIGAAGLFVALRFIHRVFRENTFLAPVVRIQKERGQRVVATGPYAIVRHPLYASAALFMPSTALLLGSWYGLASSTLLIAAFVFRIVMEERELRRGLEGYVAYTRRVRYRLVPFLW